MNTKFQNSEEIKQAFQKLLGFKSYQDEIDHNTVMIMYRFLSEIEILTDERNMTRKELAQKIGTSASYITQLYRGNKLLNLTTIAKLQKVFDITFEIKAKSNKAEESAIDFSEFIPAETAQDFSRKYDSWKDNYHNEVSEVSCSDGVQKKNRTLSIAA